MSMLSQVFSRESLEEAWDRVKANGGTGGVDGVTLAAFEAGLSQGLAALAHDLTFGTYRPLPYRAVYMAKDDGSRRRLVIAAVRDRVAQTALAIWLQPRLEPLYHPCSFAYRPGRGVHDALAAVAAYRDRGLVHVLRADIEAFFDTVDHEVLATLLGAAGVDDEIVALVRQWLACAVADGDGCAPSSVGLPQGLPIAPALANLYLTPFDRAMVDGGWKITRYADDFVVCCAAPEDPPRALAHADRALVPLKLHLHKSKTQITSFSGGFTFLGAGFVGDDILPATPHPYEQTFAPPPPAPARDIPPSGVPSVRLRTLYVQQQGAYLGRHGGRLVVTRDRQSLLDLPAHQIDQIFLFGRVHVSAAAMAFCLTRRMPIHLFSGTGRYHGALLAVDGAEFHVERAQYRLLDDVPRRLVAARAVVDGKLANSLALLRRHERNHPETRLDDVRTRIEEARGRSASAPDMDTLRGFEGAAAAAHFEGFSRCLRGACPFRGRNRRPPLDPVNSLLSFGYTLLLYQIQSCLAARGLDPAVGIFHESGRGHPALASDLLEELRAPVVDSLVLTIVNRRQFVPDDFYRGPGEPQPCLLKDEPRARYLQAFEEKLAELMHHPEAGHLVNWRQVIELQTGRLRRYILGETTAYAPFITE
ncbi:MAG TPA: CRISPR-associated endonuclease Cas1 [Candidatus Hydrogenedentes bacterium]|nr:CRISPR-associated endonuclease Cas1 [Candidatus Hydrogenedentota bacterium]HPG70123.1 CRISPR-associated endonuclease Cas1 [Candidatus Hydrogenedentota bacterium]